MSLTEVPLCPQIPCVSAGILKPFSLSCARAMMPMSGWLDRLCTDRIYSFLYLGNHRYCFFLHQGRFCFICWMMDSSYLVSKEDLLLICLLKRHLQLQWKTTQLVFHIPEKIFIFKLSLSNTLSWISADLQLHKLPTKSQDSTYHNIE